MRVVPPWALLSAAAAPVMLIGGWTIAAARQPGGFDPVAGTISALAARDAADRWIRTAALLGLGLPSHCVTAAGLRPLRRAGRLLLARRRRHRRRRRVPAAGRGRLLDRHGVAAAVAFTALALWPAAAVLGRRTPDRAVGLPASGGTTAAVLLLALVGWFVVELIAGGPRVGLAERLAAGAEAICPLLVVLALHRPRRALEAGC
ncbi:DUF998 domain-containing protein [Micromonospora sp. R77]|uniref:DUF998 domain-containing protein n=1 Tax=Micromonospora sp. R77 TaxID=2925836 RepID=UPI001F624C2B|nr:DUF998 domain-containing protein [Micromonospora sp. R77]MCI4065429.1 DUF998 domain-containing protein [Micromonospora sp. R77]